MSARDKVARSYVICTTVRSGSWMLCAALAKTGVAGRPAEYFGQTLWEQLVNNKDLLKIGTVREFMDEMIRASTTDNGVFGTKLPANHTGMFIRRASDSRGTLYTSLRTALESEFPNLRYVWLTREDKIAQAVSLYRAVMTGGWRNARDPATQARLAALEYDQYGIERCYEDIIASDAYWHAFFEKHGVEPIRVSFEDLVGNYDHAVRRLLEALDLPWHASVPPPGTVRLSDERSLEWIARFRAAGPGPAHIYPPDRFWAPY